MEMFKFVPMRILALLLLPVISIAQTHNEAKELLNKVYEKTLSLETQYISFTNTIQAPSNGDTKKRSSNGELYALGEKVRIKTDAFEFLSDGKNAYLIYPEDEEIEKTVSGEETSLSPSDILKNYQSGYSYKLAGKTTENGKLIQYVVLKPVVSEEIREIMIGIDTHSMLLENYVQFGTNGINTTFSVNAYKVNIPLNSNLFNINSKEFEGYYRL